jgi:hypothetical protein
MRTPLTVPPAVVSLLRSALLVEIGDAAAEISSTSALARREHHPGWIQQHLERFDTHRHLLDTIGWTETPAQTSVEIDLDRHRHALINALTNQLDTELDQQLAPLESTNKHRRTQMNADAIDRFLADVTRKE